MTQEQRDAAEAQARLTAFEEELRAVIDRHVALAGGDDRPYARYLALSALAEVLAQLLATLARQELADEGDPARAQAFTHGLVSWLDQQLVSRPTH